MKKEIDITNWNRKEHFEFFSAFDEPFFGITTPIECSIAIEKAKAIQIPFWAEKKTFRFGSLRTALCR